jgi:branched-chain amino acid transport system ATP-binding protein
MPELSTPVAEVVLEVDRLEVNYGAVKALRGVSLSLKRGEIVTLIGANGAGKSTTLRAIMGLVPAVSGAISYRGAPLAGRPTFRIVRDRMTLVPEGRAVFANLTVRENLDLGAYCRHEGQDVAADIDRVFTIFPRLKEVPARRGPFPAESSRCWRSDVP